MTAPPPSVAHEGLPTFQLLAWAMRHPLRRRRLLSLVRYGRGRSTSNGRFALVRGVSANVHRWIYGAVRRVDLAGPALQGRIEGGFGLRDRL
jgi:hypothetical protein